MRVDKPMAEAPQHARLSPSSAHRWLACPGSIGASGTSPDVPSRYAAEGTMLHHFVEVACRTGKYPKVGSSHTFDGFTFEIEREHIQCLKWAVAKFRALLKEIDDPNVEVHFEVRLNLRDAIEVGCFGTSDVIIYSPKLRSLYVLDWKFGAGVRVDAEGNEQLIAYALGAYDMLEYVYPIERVVFLVAQPRLDHYDNAELLVPDLESWRRVFKAGAAMTHQPNAKRTAGDHCRWCPAKASCPEVENRALEVARAAFDDDGMVELTPADLEGSRIARILAQVGMVREFLNAVEVEAKRRIETGQSVPGFKLVRGRKARSWSNEDALKRWAKEQKVVPYDMKLLSPAAVEELCESAKVEFPQALVVETYGNPSLVPVTDKRPELMPAFEVVVSSELADLI